MVNSGIGRLLTGLLASERIPILILTLTASAGAVSASPLEQDLQRAAGALHPQALHEALASWEMLRARRGAQPAPLRD